MQNDTNTLGHTQWFYFKVTNPRAGVPVKFNILNYNKPDSMFNYGMKVSVYSEQKAEAGLAGWHRTCTDISYFKSISLHLPLLETLNLQNCGWVKNHCLMAICKLENLKTLNLRGCFRIGECFAYTALALKFGFNSIEKFDLRDTDMSDMSLACFR